MLGSIAGDIIGSVFEFSPTKDLDFPLFSTENRFTDDTVLSLATAFSLLTDGDYAQNYRIFGRLYPLAGYGERFQTWLGDTDGQPYCSWGNGSAMRVSPIGFALNDEAEVLNEAAKSASVTHDHPEGVKGAQAVALAIFLARSGADKQQIRCELTDRFGYDLSRTPDQIRPAYSFDVSCQGSVPEALICALDGTDWEHSIRLAVSLGGDSDTQACIAGGLAQAIFGAVPETIAVQSKTLLPEHLLEILDDFCGEYDK